VSRLTQARRWSVQEQRRGAAPMTENAITPEEARTALEAVVMQLGRSIVPDNVRGRPMQPAVNYDPRSDRFTVLARRTSDGVLEELTVYGETVAKTVMAARMLRGTVKPLRRRTLAERRRARARG
jgi:hypothetical protein